MSAADTRARIRKFKMPNVHTWVRIPLLMQMPLTKATAARSSSGRMKLPDSTATLVLAAEQYLVMVDLRRFRGNGS